MAKNITVNYENKPCYDILIRRDFSDLVQAIKNGRNKKSERICIVCDSEVAKHYLKNVYNLLKEEYHNVFTFQFPNGESSKNLGTVEKLYDILINYKFDRNDLLIALGGGVVGDLCGYTAATYLRGIDFVQIPTTLLSQVDSSIGGKTGVDFHQYKNMVGAFYMPKLVYMNLTTLQTLPQVQIQSGMGEIIKHGLIKNKDYYQWLKEHKEQILSLDLDYLEEMIYQSCLIKKQVVEEDPKEAGIRAHLNFGHTLGHAVEKLSDFQLYHGQCVAIGMVGAAYLSMTQQNITQKEYEDIVSTILSFGLPVTVDGLAPDDILNATKSDKKMIGSKIKFVILNRVGEAVIYTDFSSSDLLSAIGQICK